MSKQIEVKINGVTYLPENTSSTADKSPEEKDVDYRALVNDKLRGFRTFYEGDKKGSSGQLYLTRKEDSFANSDRFIIAGRVQEVIKDVAFYVGGYGAALGVKVGGNGSWEQVYRLLLDNECFIKTGTRNE